MRAATAKKKVFGIFLLISAFALLLTPTVIGDELPLLHEKTFKVSPVRNSTSGPHQEM
jgi:hypothetical protein